ncbi:MAG TPA: BON domain-containing protein [Anaerolineales bacterium]|nr:BON domain-containing protein [Anaerolineales bacterium]
MFAKRGGANPLLRLDDSIQAEIWEAVWRHEEIRSLDIDNFSVSVKEGEVQLSGHLSRENNLQLIEKTVRSVPGVVTVHNGLVVDRDLINQVAEALARDQRTRPLILPVNCIHGWVCLGGEVPTSQLQSVAEEVAAQVPSVRGVVGLPKVARTHPDPMRREVQPRIDTPLYGDGGQVGIVTQVVIQPRNRLVTQLIVSDLKSDKYLLPIDALEVVNKESAFLQRSSSLCTFPIFDPSGYFPAPSDWQSPYPYGTTGVLWPGNTNRNAP